MREVQSERETDGGGGIQREAGERRTKGGNKGIQKAVDMYMNKWRKEEIQKRGEERWMMKGMDDRRQKREKWMNVCACGVNDERK